MEETFQPGEHQTDDATEGQGKKDLHQRLHNEGGDMGGAVLQGLGDAEGDGEDDQAHRVIQGNDRQQDIRDRAFGLVLTDDHQGGGRRGGGGNGAQGDGHGHGQQVRHEIVQGNQRDIHEQGGHTCLDDADDGGLLSGLPESGKPELMADGEGDEAQGHIGDHGQGIHLFKGVETETGDPQSAQNAGTDQHAGHQVGRDIGQMKFDKQAGHQET